MVNVIFNEYSDSDTFQFYRIGLPGIPLADIQILVRIDTYVMTVFENRLVLYHQLKFSIPVFGFGASRIGDDFIVSVKDGHKTGIGSLI